MLIDNKAVRSEFDPILLQNVYETLKPFIANCEATGNVDGLKRLLDRQLHAYATPKAMSDGSDALEIRFFCDVFVNRHGCYDHAADCLTNSWWDNIVRRRECYQRVKNKMLPLMCQYVIDALLEAVLAVGAEHFNEAGIEISFEKFKAGELMYLPRILVPMELFDPALPAVTRIVSLNMVMALLKRFHNAEMRGRFLNAIDTPQSVKNNFGIGQDAQAIADIAMARFAIPMLSVNMTQGMFVTQGLNFKVLKNPAPQHTQDFFIQK